MKKTIILLICVLPLFMSCSKPPTDEMNRAIEALTRAENDYDAVNYADNTLSRAREALRKMQEEAGVKRYETAKNFAADVVTLSERAVSEGRAEAIRVREEAANVVVALQIPLSEAETALNGANAGNFNVDYSGLTEILEEAKTAMEEAERSLSENTFEDVIEKSRDVRSALNGINAQLNEAARDLSKKN